MSNVVSYLESKNIELHPASNGNVRTLCWFHGEDGEAKTGRLYIQADSEHPHFGQFFCHRCDERGTFNKIRHHFGDAPDGEVTPVEKSKRLQILSQAAQYYHERLIYGEGTESDPQPNLEALEYLQQERGLSMDVILRFKLGVADGQLGDYLLMNGHQRDHISSTGLVWDTGKDFFTPGMIMIPYFVQGTCAQIRGRDLGAVKNKYKTPPGQLPIPFNIDIVLEENSFIVFTEGEFDAILLEDLGYSAIGIPGARSFQEEWLRSFADVRKVFICFDNDEPGCEGAEKIAGWLGGKSRIVEMPTPPLGEKKIDVTDYFIKYGYKVEDFDQLLRRASSGQLVSVMDAFEMWREREGNPTLTGVELGFDLLDTAIRPGLLPGQVMVMLARTGTGKTIAAINVIQRQVKMYPDRTKILFVSLEQTQNEWFERARRIHGFYNPHLIPSAAIEGEAKGKTLEDSTVDFYRNNFMMIDKNRLSPDDLRTNIRQAEDELQGDITMVVVDYLGYWARAFKGEPYVRTSEAIMAMKEIAKDMQVPIYAPHQVNRGSEPGKPIKLNDARESGVIEETADFVISLMNDMNDPGVGPAETNGSWEIEYLKSRHGGVGVSAALRFAPVSLALVPLHDTVYGDDDLRRAKDELHLWKKSHFDYTEVLRRHREGDRSFVR